MKNIAKLKIPILVLPEMYVTNPTTRGPNNAKFSKHVVYTKVLTVSTFLELELSNKIYFNAWIPPCTSPISIAIRKNSIRVDKL